jgi:hypothetical protein
MSKKPSPSSRGSSRAAKGAKRLTAKPKPSTPPVKKVLTDPISDSAVKLLLAAYAGAQASGQTSVATTALAALRDATMVAGAANLNAAAQVTNDLAAAVAAGTLTLAQGIAVLASLAGGADWASIVAEGKVFQSGAGASAQQVTAQIAAAIGSSGFSAGAAVGLLAGVSAAADPAGQAVAMDAVAKLIAADPTNQLVLDFLGDAEVATGAGVLSQADLVRLMLGVAKRLASDKGAQIAIGMAFGGLIALDSYDKKDGMSLDQAFGQIRTAVGASGPAGITFPTAMNLLCGAAGNVAVSGQIEVGTKLASLAHDNNVADHSVIAGIDAVTGPSPPPENDSTITGVNALNLMLGYGSSEGNAAGILTAVGGETAKLITNNLLSYADANATLAAAVTAGTLTQSQANAIKQVAGL